MPYERELDAARQIAARAGEVALRYQQRGVSAETKTDLSPVTIADRECEALIVQFLRENFPEDGLLGEEGASGESRNGRKWIIDPIDGTRDFVRNNPHWAILLALEVDGEIETGVAHFPALDETYFGLRGAGSYQDGTRLRISSVTTPAQAIACVNGLIQMERMPFAPRLIPWMSQFFAIRSLGGGPDAMMLAAGQADVWIEPSCQPWDLAPLKVILEEAGARFLNFDGGSSIYQPNCIACVPALEEVARALVAPTFE